jgi:hypothetical protein
VQAFADITYNKNSLFLYLNSVVTCLLPGISTATNCELTKRYEDSYILMLTETGECKKKIMPHSNKLYEHTCGGSRRFIGWSE